MKRLICIAFICLPYLLNAQLPAQVVFDPKSMAESIKLLAETKKQVYQAQKTYAEIKGVQSSVSELVKMQKEIERKVKSLQGLKGLSWNDLNKLFSFSMHLGAGPGEFQIRGAMKSHNLLRAGTTPTHTKRLFEHFHKGTTARSPSLSFTKLNQARAEKGKEQYAAALLLKHKQFQLAQVYQKTAEELAKKSQELSKKANLEGKLALSLSEAERIQTQKAAHDLMLKSIEYREKSASMLEKALQKDPIQTAVDGAYVHQMRMKQSYSEMNRLLFGK